MTANTVIVRDLQFTASADACAIIHWLRKITNNLPNACSWPREAIPLFIKGCVEDFILAWLRDKSSSDSIRIRYYENTRVDAIRYIEKFVAPELAARKALLNGINELHELSRR